MRLSAFAFALAPLILLAAPGSALACGGLFCDTTQPVNQSAERILFGFEEQTLHMHVRINYRAHPT